MMLMLIIKLVFWFGWFCSIAFAQLEMSESVSGYVNFPIACLGNIAAFITCFIRGRLDLENGAREALGILTVPLRGSKLEKIIGINGNEIGLRTVSKKIYWMKTTVGSGLPTVVEAASVVMLSNRKSNCSMKQFMKSNAFDDVHSILLQYRPLDDASPVNESSSCHCIMLDRVAENTHLPEALNKLLCHMPNNGGQLLPCRQCLTNSRHECTPGHLGESVVPDFLDSIRVQRISAAEGGICICIPLNDARDDNWTKRLASSLSSKDEESRGVRLTASKALQDYVDGNTGRVHTDVEVYFDIGSFLWPRFSEILINIVITFWFKVDGFSSSLAARRTVRDYLVNSKGNGLAANAFLSEATVYSHANHVCQVLCFRDDCFSIVTLSFIAGSINLICLIGWAVLIAFEVSDSVPRLSKATVAVIIGAIGISFGMDCLYLYSKARILRERKPDYGTPLVIILEMVCVAAGIVVVKIVGTHVFGKWIYSALQVLVWVKWAIGSYILDKYRREKFGSQWRVLVFSSAFLLNAALAGVRSKWRLSWPWQANSLFSKAWHH